MNLRRANRAFFPFPSISLLLVNDFESRCYVIFPQSRGATRLFYQKIIPFVSLYNVEELLKWIEGADVNIVV